MKSKIMIIGVAAIIVVVAVAACLSINGNDKDDSPEQYIVIFNTLNGSGGFSQFVKSGESIILPDSSAVTREGYTLKSWNESIDATGQTYEPGSNFKPDCNSTLYAIWDQNTRDVIFNIVTEHSTSTYLTQTVAVGDTASIPEIPNVSEYNTHYYFIGWEDQNGQLWDFNQPIYDDLTLNSRAGCLFYDQYRGFKLQLDMDAGVQKGWTHRISWGDGTTETYNSGSGYSHQYDRPGNTTVTVKSTSPEGITYTVSYSKDLLSDSTGKIIPAAYGGPVYDYKVTDGAGNYLGIGNICIFYQTILSASIDGVELDETKINLMNSLRDLSNSVSSGNGKWIYEYTGANGKEYSTEYNAYRIGYGDISYDIITERGIVMEVHIGGSVNLHFVINEYYSKI